MGARTGLQPEAIARALHGAFCRGEMSAELCQLAASKMHQAGPPYDIVSIFTCGARGELRLTAGRGTAPATHRLHEGQSADHVPQDQARPSVLVAVIRRHDEILGEIRIESQARDAFSSAERAAVEGVAAALAALL